MLLEATQHPSSLFVTLTYAPEHEPENGFLVPEHLQKFLRKLRKLHHGKVRFFAVGEYGDENWRPHYHLALFGDFQTELREGHLVSDEIERAWKYGFVHIGFLTPESAGYLTRYVLKRKWDKYEFDLAGLPPEFARMSLRPGIGATAIGTFAKPFFERAGSAGLAKIGDAPSDFKTQGRKYTLGRYLHKKLRQELGRSDKTPAHVSLARSAAKLLRDDSKRESVRVQHSRIAAQRVRTKQRASKL